MLAALAFALTVPVTKAVVADVNAWLLAGLLYLGSGVGLAIICIVRGRRWTVPRRDLGYLAGAIISGGMIAPVLLLFGLRGVPASTVSLLLTSEGVFTSVLAWVVFREHIDRRILLGFVAITAGAVVLAAAPGLGGPPAVGAALLVLAACLFWGIDNNLTRNVSLSDPVQVAAAKGLAAGITNSALAMALGAAWPGAATASLAGVVGFVGYGLSLALFVYALRELGTARTGAYFSTAPFIAAALSVVFLHEPLTGWLAVAGALMLIGVWLHVSEKHAHEHEPEALEHAHAHEHDAHHDHHGPGEPVLGVHSHRHEHGGARHTHPHFPDAHHRHRH
jgi:drug/metabolite transporter (DMT)-like permease